MKMVPLVLAIFLLSCQSESIQKKAEKAVIAHLKQVLNDPKSYELVKFDSVRVDSSDVINDVSYLVSKAKHDAYQKLFDSVNNETDALTPLNERKLNLKLMTKFYDSMNIISKESDNIIKAFKPVKIGYVIHHTYRGRNKMNALILQDDYFHLDSLMNVK